MPGPELLAPAGSWESLAAAVQNGADAVYLGATAFSARQSAADFEPRELSRAVDYAHVRDVRVYVTVNTLVSERELGDAARLLGFLYNIGVDAVIVQDLGLMRLIADLLPGLTVHASTQTTAHNRPTLELFKELGVRRVVLARELSLDEIAGLKRDTGMEVEVFVHGALCISYSGQCLFSSLVGARSGNRGRCAQPCRLPYVLHRDGEPAVPLPPGRYLLSPRDLNLSTRLPELIRAGVDGLKIEGRMRRPEYVATVVRVYRTLLDRAAVGAFDITAEERRELLQIFNRGYTTGYLSGRPGRALMAYTRPNHRGLALGRVLRYEPDTGSAVIALEEPLQVGDTIEVWVTRGGRVSTPVREIRVDGRLVKEASGGTEVTLPVGGRVGPGDRVFKTVDARLERRARESFTSGRETKSIPLRFEVRVREGLPLELAVTGPGGLSASAQGKVPAVRAEKRPLTAAVFEKQLSRLGNTPFVLGELECRIEGEVMLPLSDINEARREAVDTLAAAKAARSRPSTPVTVDLADRVGPYLQARTASQARADSRRTLLSAAVGDLDGVRAAAGAGADVVYFPGEGLGSPTFPETEEVSEAAAVCRRHGATLVLWLPRILHDRERPRWERLLEAAGPCGVLAGNPGVFRLTGTQRRLLADFPLNIFNSLTVSLFAGLGAAGVTLSPELTLDQIREITGKALVPVEVLVHGALPVLVSEYCVVGGVLGPGDGNRCSVPCRAGRFALEDRLGLRFPVGVDHDCRMHVFNVKDLCVVDQVPELIRCGVAVLRVEGRLRDADYVGGVVGIYREVIDNSRIRGPEWQVPSHYRERLERLSPQGLTTGHYFRGVL
ncbi:DUF3656 domain-containing U32 family peptidase [Candidatus Desulforudis audaxviator]|uniref:Peptidase U32 n=1 Tax=Desulforudis audaxviator (strain MP104C) TaxID=477974 RepID=B1I474_DESAP|nr:DUF3656 domain-containing protein [Candidatus Desulforudis audaxviator]ACA59883.1 peptidase U32 [Candidatus Desulforudis audaxviator MP104C]AZK59889.1 peptidase U32 [Candidatus Desulforudis audaxviator]